MTNYEKIKRMSVEEIAALIDFLNYEDCKLCKYEHNKGCSDVPCKIGRKEWLEMEAEE